MRGKGLDKEFPRAILAYMYSLCKSEPGHFASWVSRAVPKGSSMKNEGPSRDVVENTWLFQTVCHPSRDVEENKGIAKLSTILLKTNEMQEFRAQNAPPFCRSSIPSF